MALPEGDITVLTVEHVTTAGWEPALRGMRNPLDSWDKADSEYDVWRDVEIDAEANLHEAWREPVNIGPNDESLMRRLIAQGSSDHCKFRRMIAIWFDVTAPLYWHKEMDTYKVGTVANSCSTMHTIMKREFTADMFSWEDLTDDFIIEQLALLNNIRGYYLRKKAEHEDEYAELAWRALIQTLPSSWNQKRTLMLSYEVMANIYRARRHHKLQEWHDFIDSIVEAVPYPWIFTGEGC